MLMLVNHEQQTTKCRREKERRHVENFMLFDNCLCPREVSRGSGWDFVPLVAKPARYNPAPDATVRFRYPDILCTFRLSELQLCETKQMSPSSRCDQLIGSRGLKSKPSPPVYLTAQRLNAQNPTNTIFLAGSKRTNQQGKFDYDITYPLL